MIVIDTSVVAKWFIEEESSYLARRLMSKDDLAAPDLLVYELINVLIGNPKFTEADLFDHLFSFYQFPIQLYPLSYAEFKTVIHFSKKYKITSYDASFLVLADALKADFITADLRLVSKVKQLLHVHLL